MADGRKNNGGARPGAGRKPVFEEAYLKDIGKKAIAEIFGSEEKNFIDIAKKAKDNFAYCKLLMEYVYGKPKESVNMNIGETVTEIKFIDE